MSTDSDTQPDLQRLLKEQAPTALAAVRQAGGASARRISAAEALGSRAMRGRTAGVAIMQESMRTRAFQKGEAGGTRA